MKKKSKILFGIITIALIAGLLYNQTTDKSVKPIENNELVKLKLGYIPIADCAQAYIAKDKGFFEEQGLDIELIKLAGGAKILEALAGNSIDIAFSNVVSVMLANNGGLEFRAITGGPRTNENHKETALMVLENSDIKTLKQLEGKKIAVNTRKNIVELFVLNYLRQNDVDVSDIQFIEVSFPQMYQVLSSKGVDAIATIEPFVTFSKESGGVSSLGDYIIPVLSEVELSTYNVNQKMIDNNSEIVRKIKTAIQKATKFSEDNKKELRTIIANNTSLSEEQVSNIILPYYGSEVDANSFNNILDFVKKEGWITNTLKSSDIIQ